MEKMRMSTKGQVIVPKSIRDARGWGAGMDFVVVESGEGILLKPARLFPKSSLDQVAGCVGYAGEPKSIEEMKAGVAAKVRERYGRGRH